MHPKTLKGLSLGLSFQFFEYLGFELSLSILKIYSILKTTKMKKNYLCLMYVKFSCMPPGWLMENKIKILL